MSPNFHGALLRSGGLAFQSPRTARLYRRECTAHRQRARASSADPSVASPPRQWREFPCGCRDASSCTIPEPLEKPAKNTSLSIGVVTPENIVEDGHQIAIVVDWHGVRCKDASSRAFHLPEGDVFLAARLAGISCDWLRKDDQESVAVCLLFPSEILRFEQRRTTNSAKHKHHGRILCEMHGPVDQIRPIISIVSAGSSL